MIKEYKFHIKALYVSDSQYSLDPYKHQDQLLFDAEILSTESSIDTEVFKEDLIEALDAVRKNEGNSYWMVQSITYIGTVESSAMAVYKRKYKKTI